MENNSIPRINSIGLFIDGGYYADIDKGLLAESRRLNLKGLIKYLQKTIAEKFGLPTEQCLVTESHFYRGRFRSLDAKRAGTLESDRIFEDRLIENFKNMFLNPDERKRFIKQVIRDWYDGRISPYGLLSVNYV